MGVHVPHDVIFNHILPRVPAESVGRFKCVSKEWHSFLTSDTFKNKHNRHMDNHKNNPKLLVVLSETETSFKFTTIDCEAPPSDKGLNPTSRPLPQFEDTNPHKIHILTSFHGLVCLGIIEMDLSVYSHLILWNPLTNEYKRLSKSNSHKECNNIWHYSFSNFGLYYSFGEDDYKLLFVNYFHDDNVYIYMYSLKSDSWRKVDIPQHTSILYLGRWSGGTYLNENLYFLQEHSNGRLSSIIRFDTKTERLSKIETPSKISDYGYNYLATIMVKSDCIHVCVMYDIKRGGFKRNCIKLWKLDDNENMKEVVTYQLSTHAYDHTIISYLIPFHLMKNGSWLMNHRYSYKHRIYEVDLKKKKHIKDKGREDGTIIYDDYEYAEVRVDDKNNHIVAVEGSYIETFVSPNRYMK